MTAVFRDNRASEGVERRETTGGCRSYRLFVHVYGTAISKGVSRRAEREPNSSGIAIISRVKRVNGARYRRAWVPGYETS